MEKVTGKQTKAQGFIVVSQLNTAVVGTHDRNILISDE